MAHPAPPIDDQIHLPRGEYLDWIFLHISAVVRSQFLTLMLAVLVDEFRHITP